MTYKIDDIMYYNDAKLSVAIAPGKKDEKNDRDLYEDLNHIQNNNYQVIICLLEWKELEYLQIHHYPLEAQNRNFYFYHFPIQDHHIPTIEDTKILINLIIKHLKENHNILIHCSGGVGRAGTISACLLCYLGYDPETSINTVRNLRERAIKRPAQVDFIFKYHEFLKSTN